MGDRLAADVDQGISPTPTHTFGEWVAVGVGFTQKGGDCLGEDEAGFGVEPAVGTPHPVGGLGQVKRLRRPLFGCFGGGLFGFGLGTQVISRCGQLRRRQCRCQQRQVGLQGGDQVGVEGLWRSPSG